MMIPTTASNVAQTLSSAMLGIASVILEGRAISDDDFILHEQPYNGIHHFQRLKDKLGQLKQATPITCIDTYSSPEISVKSNYSLDEEFNVNFKEENLSNNIMKNQTQFTAEFICEDNPLLSLQSLVTSSLCSTPRSVFDTRFWGNARQHTDSKNMLSESMLLENSCTLNDLKTTILSKSAPKQGPHCEQFLKKIGIFQNTDSNIDYEEHICDTSIENEICYHWRIHCLEIDTITSRNEPICIEVYIGPESDAILLEQWTIEYKNKLYNPLMNLSALCTAIRSQLYFSQITAWSDLIRKNDNHELQNTGRFKYPTTGGSNNWMKKPRLDIFYRIKPHDCSSITYFKSQPIIHNFPLVIINENYGLSVTLRSLPRIQNIPIANLTKSSMGWSKNKLFSPEKLPDDCKYGNKSFNFQEINTHNYNTTDDENEDFFNDSEQRSNILKHKEKQVLKYKMLINKRDTCKRKSDADYNSEKKSLLNLPEFGSINSNRPPLYHEQAITKNIPESVQIRNVEMISIGTQTILSNNIPCEICGNVISILCLNCHSIKQKQETISNMMGEINCSKTNQAELLLNAIKKTSKHKKNSKDKKNVSCLSNSKSIKTLNETDCKICKRQKIQHTYQNTCESNINFMTDATNYKLKKFGCDCNDKFKIGQKKEIFDEFYPSPKTQFKTPKKIFPISISQHLTKLVANEKTSMEDSNTYIHNSSSLSKKLIPKVNLTQIFCNPSVDLNSVYSASTVPITTTTTTDTVRNINFDIPMQKSNSAPSLPSSSSSSCLSPRFIKQSIAYNFRRARHSSERSDRSSIGSDEQLSDDDLDLLGIFNTNNDTIFKNRPSLKSSRPLLGNLEESLFQKRIFPQKCITGFKILLGASGEFCPPQMTIQAASYFYRIEGQTLCTPYVCEVRMPRRGYKVPLKGNIQATLLNPEGTVVRMFVIPYDLQDMPPLHQTFIRQRILTGGDVDRNILKQKPILSTSFMKFLRYSIHLRFQTSKSGRLSLHTDVRIIILRKTDCDTAAAHAKGDIESPKELTIITVIPEDPKYSVRKDNFIKFN